MLEQILSSNLKILEGAITKALDNSLRYGEDGKQKKKKKKLGWMGKKQNLDEDSFITDNGTEVLGGGPGSGRHKGFGQSLQEMPDAVEEAKGKNTKFVKKVVDPRKLIPTQERLDKTKVKDIVENGTTKDEDSEGDLSRPRVFSYKGQMYIHDGHHRVAASILKGDKRIDVNYAEVKTKSSASSGKASDAVRAHLLTKGYQRKGTATSPEIYTNKNSTVELHNNGEFVKKSKGNVAIGKGGSEAKILITAGGPGSGRHRGIFGSEPLEDVMRVAGYKSWKRNHKTGLVRWSRSGSNLDPTQITTDRKGNWTVSKRVGTTQTQYHTGGKMQPSVGLIHQGVSSGKGHESLAKTVHISDDDLSEINKARAEKKAINSGAYHEYSKPQGQRSSLNCTICGKPQAHSNHYFEPMNAGGPGSGRHQENLDLPAKSLKHLNKHLSHELVKGKGYHYFPDAIGRNDQSLGGPSESVYVSNHSHMSINKWKAVHDKIFNFSNEDAGNAIQDRYFPRKGIKAGGPGSGRHKGPESLTHEERLALQRKEAGAIRRANQSEGKSVRGRLILTDKQKRAVANVVTATKEHHDKAEELERLIAKHTGGTQSPNNKPFDVLVNGAKKKHGIEVKAVLLQKNDKLTMKKEAIDRKLAAAKKQKLTMHTVAGDLRGKKLIIYHRAGVGSFRLGKMDVVKGGLKGLAALFK